MFDTNETTLFFEHWKVFSNVHASKYVCEISKRTAESCFCGDIFNYVLLMCIAMRNIYALRSCTILFVDSSTIKLTLVWRVLRFSIFVTACDGL